MIKKIKLKSIISVLTIFTTVFSLVGCGNNSNGGNNPINGNKEIAIAVTSFADTLEPTEQYFSWVVSRYGVGETLVKFNQKGELEPCLAEKWEVSDNKLTWTFDIRQNVKFSNGDDMTPELVKASIERTFRLSKRADSFFKIKDISVEGNKLSITTEQPVANLPGSLADPLFLIVDTKADESKFAMEGPVCTGPYLVESFNPTQDCVVVKNKNYWDGEVPLDKVTFKCIEDQSTRSMALQTGEVQIAYNLKVENLNDFQDKDKFLIQNLKSLRTTYAFMNQNGVLKDKKLRQAIIRALDKEKYCNELLEGGATPGKAPVPSTLDFGFDELKDENAYNVESARNLLKEAGYNDVDGDGFVETPSGDKMELNFVIYTSREELNIYAQAVQANLKEIGVNVKLNTVSYETTLDMRDAGKFDMLIWNVLVANTGDPEKYLNENWYSKSGTNKTGYNNPQVDQLLDELSKEFDLEKRKELIINIQQLIMDDAATIFLGHETTYLISSTKVTGVNMYPMDYYWLTKDVKLS